MGKRTEAVTAQDVRILAMILKGWDESAMIRRAMDGALFVGEIVGLASDAQPDDPPRDIRDDRLRVILAGGVVEAQWPIADLMHDMHEGLAIIGHYGAAS